jgi:DNA-binding transcriptional regulator GbsR (MarR family)
MTDSAKTTTEESLVRIGLSSSNHEHEGVIDLTTNDSFFIETDGPLTDGPLKKRRKLKRLKQSRPETAIPAGAHIDQAADRTYEVTEHRSILENQLLDQRHILEEPKERPSNIGVQQQSCLASAGTECNAAKPASAGTECNAAKPASAGTECNPAKPASAGTECNPIKPAPVKRKRIVESDGEAVKVVSSTSHSMQLNPLPMTKRVKKTETLSVEKKKKNSKPTLQDKILKSMFVACKPFNLNNLLTETQTTSDSTLSFTLLSLVDKNLIIKKDFISAKGSTKTLYWANLDMVNHKDAAQAIRIQYRDDEMAAALQEHKKLNDQLQQIECAVESLLKQATNEELDEKIKQIELDICSRNERIHKAIEFKENILSKAVSSKTIKMRINKYREEWKRRKEKVKTFVENLSDAMEKKEKDVVKMLDIETDEMVGTKLPPKLI